jgi:pimeloyl-ACP methyl ester carboxylesterase
MSEAMESVFTSPEGEAAIKALYGKMTAAWPLPWERIRLDTEIGSTAVLACGGQGDPPLVLLHGTLSNSGIWLGDIAELARGRRVYALDIPGEPGYSDPRRASWQDSSYALWLEEVLDRLGLLKPAIAGISLGAWIALAFAAMRPARAGPMALLCPSGLARPRPSLIPRAIAASLAGERGMRAFSRALYGRLPVPEGALEAGMAFASHARPRYETPRLLSDEEIGRIESPILLVVGGRDIMLDSRRGAARLARLQAGAVIRLVSEAGHVLMGFGGEISAFLDECASA